MIGRFGRMAHKSWQMAAGLVALLLLLAAPGSAPAKPFPTDPGPAEEGDPTADDQPSPTPPKHSRSFSSLNALTTQNGTHIGRDRYVRIAWLAYLRLIARITLP